MDKCDCPPMLCPVITDKGRCLYFIKGRYEICSHRKRMKVLFDVVMADKDFEEE
jgi:hypothetical protein